MTITPEKSTVSSAAVRDIYMACKTLGLLSPEQETSLGIERSLFDEPQARIPEIVLIRLWRLLEEGSPDPGIGLSIGQTIAPESKGLLASWVSQASTLGEALDIFFEHIELMNAAESWKISEQGSHVTLTLENKGLEAYPLSAIERSMSAMVTWARVLSAHAFPLLSTHFKCPQPEHAELFTAIFGEQLCFDAQHNSLSFDHHLLDLPIVSSNHLLKTMIEEKAKAALAQLSKEASVSTQVKTLIANALSQNQAFGIEQACKILAKSRQTLYRQLKQEGTDFQTIYDESRKAQALTLLKQGTTNITGISLQLGFKDSSSFYKAFRRWTGMSPKDYLEQRSYL